MHVMPIGCLNKRTVEILFYDKSKKQTNKVYPEEYSTQDQKTTNKKVSKLVYTKKSTMIN